MILNFMSEEIEFAKQKVAAFMKKERHELETFS